MIGKVVRSKMKNTVVVEVERMVSHKVYKKRLKKTSRFSVHDEIGVKEGDFVRFEQIKPMSKTKYHKVVAVITEKAAAEGKEK